MTRFRSAWFTTLVLIQGAMMTPGWSQTGKLDSLRALLQEMAPDTHKVNQLIDIGLMHLHRSDYPNATHFYQEALDLSEKLDFTWGKALAHGNLGIVEYHLGRYDRALAHQNTSLQLRLRYPNRSAIADTYSNIGMVYSGQGYYDKAIEAFTTTLNYRDENDLRGRSAAYNNLGIAYYDKGDYHTALDYFLRSLHLDEAAGDQTELAKLDLAFSNNNVGMVYDYLNETEKALVYYKKANTLCTEMGNRECIAGTNSNIAGLLKKQGRLEEALGYHLSSLAIFQEIGNATEIGSAAGNVGGLYHAKGDYPKAMEYYTMAYQQQQAVDNLQGTAIALTNLGTLNRDMHRYPEAHAQLNESILLLKQAGARDRLQDTYLRLSMLDSMMGNFDKALVHYKLYTSLRDSIQNEANINALNDILEKYESEKKDKEIAKLEDEKNLSELQVKIKSEHIARVESEQRQMITRHLLQEQQISLLDKDKKLQALELEKKEALMAAHATEAQEKEAQLTLLSHQNEIKNLRLRKQQNLQWYSIAGFVLFGLIAVLYYIQYRTRQKLKLQLLRNKIASDLHDEVGSTLSSISIFSEVAQQQSKEVIPLLDTIRDNSRKMLEAMGDIVWTINPENDQFEKIIVRMRNFAFELLGARKIEFEFIANEDVSRLKLPMEVRKNLYLIFKEAANNLVKYSDANKAYFSVTEEKGFLTMMISDNGRGFNLGDTALGNGIENMKQRAKEIGARLNIQSFPGKGTSIELKLAI